MKIVNIDQETWEQAEKCARREHTTTEERIHASLAVGLSLIEAGFSLGELEEWGKGDKSVRCRAEAAARGMTPSEWIKQILDGALDCDEDDTAFKKGAIDGELREITIRLPIKLHDSICAASSVVGESVEKHLSNAVQWALSGVTEKYRGGEITVSNRYFKTRAAAKKATERANAFDRQNQRTWTFHRCKQGWMVETP